MMKITVIGHSLEGITTACCLSEVSNSVLFCPLDESDFSTDLFQHSSMQDRGLLALFKKQIEQGQLIIANGLNTSDHDSDLYVVALAPEDRTSLDALLDRLSEDKQCKGLIFTCSMPIGLLEKANKNRHLPVAYIPEFIREGSALADFRNPDTFIIGCENKALLALIQQLYQPFIQHHTSSQIMRITEAGFARFAISAMLATRVSFMNELANITEFLNIDIEVIKRALGSDPRIGKQYLNPGLGFGGRQLADGLSQITELENVKPDNIGLLNRVIQINERQKESLFRKVWRFFQGDIRGRTFAIWGGAFKANASRIDHAPILKLIEAFVFQDAILNIYDPGCAEVLSQYIDQNNLNGQIGICDNLYAALDGADALLIVTEWDEFLLADFDEIQLRLSAPLIFDGRNIYDPEQMKQLGYRYFAIGRGEQI